MPLNGCISYGRPLFRGVPYRCRGVTPLVFDAVGVPIGLPGVLVVSGGGTVTVVVAADGGNKEVDVEGV